MQKDPLRELPRPSVELKVTINTRGFKEKWGGIRLRPSLKSDEG